MKAAKWITLWTCSLDGAVVIECRARRNPKDDSVTVRMPGERRGTDYVACYVDEYYAATRDEAIEQFIKRQRRDAQTWLTQVEQSQQKVRQADALRQKQADKAVA
jgi:hypothetical protein